MATEGIDTGDPKITIAKGTIDGVDLGVGVDIADALHVAHHKAMAAGFVRKVTTAGGGRRWRYRKKKITVRETPRETFLVLILEKNQKDLTPNRSKSIDFKKKSKSNQT